MKKYILFLICLLVATTAIASGGGDGDKVKNPWQTGGAIIPTAFLPLGLDKDDCEFVSENDTSTVYLCDGGKVFGEFYYVEPKDTED